MIEILYEDNHIIAVHKPAGMLTHADDTGDTCATVLTKKYIKEKYNKPGNVFLQPVHRLDRPVSGLLLFARTSKATTRLTQLFKERKLIKTYYAITNRKPPEVKDTIVHFLSKNNTKNTVSTTTEKKGIRAELTYELVQAFTQKYLLKVNPLTGRSHQIRVQLASIGCSILGDIKYKSTVETDGKSICLHAAELTFDHPVQKKPLTIKCPFPQTREWSTFSY